MLGICLFPDNGWALSGNVGVSTGQSCGGCGLTARHYGWQFSSTQIWLWPFYFPLSKCNLKFHLSCTISIQALNWCFSVMFTPPATQTVPCQFSGLKKKNQGKWRIFVERTENQHLLSSRLVFRMPRGFYLLILGHLTVFCRVILSHKPEVSFEETRACG